MIDKELAQMIFMGAGAVLGPLGGYKYKWLRRFLLPGIWLLFLLLTDMPTIPSILTCIGLCVAFCLPYGENTPWPIKALVGNSYAAPTLFLGLTPWQIIVPIVFMGMFWLSNKTKFIPWKVWEFLIFGCVGIVLAVLIAK